jgi:hypothetical protein
MVFGVTRHGLEASMNTRRMFPWALLILSLALASVQGASAADGPLPSWNDGAAKRAIMDFVTRVTTPGGPDFVPEPERIATFDNDGTLWAEQPIYFQFAFVLDRIKAMAPQHPDPTGLPMRSIRASSGRTSSWGTSRCSSCSPTYA